MKIGIYAVGRLRAGPEKSLIDTYMGRIEAAGRALGITTTGITEVEEKRRLEGDALKAAEAGLLRNAIPRGAKIVLLDERGRMEPSEAFASRLGQWRDTGVSDLAFVIGGADGHDAEFRANADHLLAFGPMTWPHMLVRVLLSEQIYRSISILSGHPYHRA